MYTIQGNYIFENGINTGVKVETSKKMIAQRYGWNNVQACKNFNSIAHKIYSVKNGKYVNTVKTFTHNQVRHILNTFGCW
jgi:hypothetical protein